MQVGTVHLTRLCSLVLVLVAESNALEVMLWQVRTLCENGADPCIGDYDKRTCLHLAASCGHSDVVDFLIRLGTVDLNPVDRFGGTPLDDAYRHGFVVVVTMLQVCAPAR